MRMVQERLSMRFNCHLHSEDIELADLPFECGDSADIWEATQRGRKVVLKSCHFYASINVHQLVEVRSNHNICQVVHR